MAVLQLSTEPVSARAARQFVSDKAAQLGLTSVIDDAALLVSELVTNALQHGRPPIEVGCGPMNGGMRVFVRDLSSGHPRQRHRHEPCDQSGRGLLLVDSLADRWGVDHHGDLGKSVWFDLAP